MATTKYIEDWTIGDVHMLRPRLSKTQALAVLDKAREIVGTGKLLNQRHVSMVADSLRSLDMRQN